MTLEQLGELESWPGKHLPLAKVYASKDSDATHHELRFYIMDVAIPLLEALPALIELAKDGMRYRAATAKPEPLSEEEQAKLAEFMGVLNGD